MIRISRVAAGRRLSIRTAPTFQATDRPSNVERTAQGRAACSAGRGGMNSSSVVKGTSQIADANASLSETLDEKDA